MIKHVFALSLGFGLVISAAIARLPAPSDEAKAKAVEAAAKAAHNGKVEGFQLCASMNNVAQKYLLAAKGAGKTLTPTATPDCVNPGAYVSPTAAIVPVTGVAPAAPTAAVAKPASSATAAAPAKKS